MGLLDGKFSDDPDKNSSINQGLLALGLNLLNSKGSFGQALGSSGLQAMQAQQQTMQNLQLEKARKAQLEAMQRQAQQEQEAAAQRQRQQAFLQGLPSPQMQASQGALAGGGGPTQANAAQMPQVDPQAQQLFQAMKAGVIDYPSYLTATRKDTSPVKLGAGETLLDPKTYQPLAANPKADDTPGSVKEYQFAKQQGYAGDYTQWKRDNARAGASSVSVNTGQKGFDNTLKLRGDFRSEPIYKAHQEMQSAYAQIQQSLKLASPAGDLAGATKVMKLLDPGSVVRESELALAMAATGALDRLENYAKRVVTGQKLTPSQRQDFQTLADSLYAESVKSYNAKRSEYEGIAKRNNLNVPDVLGGESAAPSAGGWSIKPKSQ